jgi:SAM-dependent methyltransferase
MTDFVKDFYKKLTPFYHLIYPDWNRSIKRQASLLNEIFQQYWGDNVKEVLDVSCGIGTQSLGLAELGYQVTASDISPHSVERAKEEAAQRDLNISFLVADMRSAFTIHSKEFDIVISCDNSVPHLLTDKDILSAFQQLFSSTKPGGGCIISVRDYEAEEKSENEIKVYGTREESGINYIILQHWEWDDDHYDLSMYFIEDDGRKKCKTHVMRSRYYAIGTTRLIELMSKAGFVDVVRLDDVFFQPLIIGSRRT